MLLPLFAKTIKDRTNQQKPVIIAPIKLVETALLSAIKAQDNTTKCKKREKFNYLSVSSLYDYGEFYVLSPVIGAPVAVLTLEPLLAAGFRNFILFSICGGIRSATYPVQIGDLILPCGAFCDEGTSTHYEAKEEFLCEDTSLQNKLLKELVSKLSVPIHNGHVWTTDAIYKETHERVESYCSRGACGVDMEYSALLHLCNQYKATIAALFVVSDIAGADFEYGAAQDSFHKNVHDCAKLLCSFAS